MAPPQPAPEAGVAPGLALDALRAQGAPLHDPVHFAFVEALARRSAVHAGAVRQLLDARLAQALADCAARCAQRLARPGQGQPVPAARGRAGPLTDLLRHLDPPGHPPAALVAGAASVSATPSVPAQPAELKAWRQFRQTWARLSVDRQLIRSQAQLPPNPGPLNSQLLALRSLQLMQDIAPGYLQAFVAQVEVLLWLDQASLGPAPAPGKAVRRERGKPRKAAPPSA